MRSDLGTLDSGERSLPFGLLVLQGQGKVRGFCKLVREFLNTKKVREKSGNFIIWAKNIWAVAGILSILSV